MLCSTSVSEVVCVLDAKASVGESPLWSPEERALSVTSASDRLTDAERARGPLAGGLFAIDVGVRGLSEPRFAG